MTTAIRVALLLKDKRIQKIIGGALICILLIVTAAGTSCTGHNLQQYAQENVASQFKPLVTPINNQITNGSQINTELLYASYIALFDNNQYSDTDKKSIRKKLVACFYTETEKRVPNKDKDGNPVLDSDGKQTFHKVIITHAVTDSSRIFANIQKKLSITIDYSKRQYITSLSQVIGNYGSYSLSGDVDNYSTTINQYCLQYGIPEYTTLAAAVMQQESGGSGTDPMQSSECSYNKKYPHEPGSITDANYSIQVGIQYLASCLRAAKCKSPSDISGVSLALQGYNFGNGFIAWALKKGGYSQALAVGFSNIEAKKLGWSGYGDVNYVSHVLRYYNQSTGTGSFIYPIQSEKFTISSPFGPRTNPISGKSEFHKGIDLAATQGTPIFASAAGTVIYAQFAEHPYNGYGNLVIIKHSSSLVTLYGHCSKLLVSVGQAVQQGQIIAQVGNTGDSTGNHCHFEFRLNGSSVDPADYLK